MRIEFELEDVINNDELKEIAKDEIRLCIRERCTEFHEFDISNIVYGYVADLCGEQFNESLKDMLISKIRTIIADLSPYTVFHQGDTWSRDSKGYEILCAICEQLRPELESRIKSLISEIDIPNLDRYDISEMLSEAIVDRAFGDKNE